MSTGNGEIGSHLGAYSYPELDVLAADPKVSLCWGHCVVEAVPDNPYRVCFECGHVYATAGDLEALYDAEKPSDCPSRAAADIAFCQVCVHDF